MDDQTIRSSLERHWAAIGMGDPNKENEIYHNDAIVDLPQSGERIQGRTNLQISRAENPARRKCVVRRIAGCGNLWVSEVVITVDGLPMNTVSIMEFRDGKVAHETQYFADQFDAPDGRNKYSVALLDEVFEEA
jgi:hypothetical protein